MLLGLRVGDPGDEVLGAWLAKESVRDIYLTEDPTDAATLLQKAITGCREDEVAEIQSLGRTLQRWRAEILAHHETGASNGPTEGLNLLVKKVKRCGHGFRRFDHYRLRVLLLYRWHRLGPDLPTASPNPPSPLKRVEPQTIGDPPDDERGEDGHGGEQGRADPPKANSRLTRRNCRPSKCRPLPKSATSLRLSCSAVIDSRRVRGLVE